MKRGPILSPSIVIVSVIGTVSVVLNSFLHFFTNILGHRTPAIYARNKEHRHRREYSVNHPVGKPQFLLQVFLRVEKAFVTLLFLVMTI